jgi:ribulose-5-phosphate 4-epimerase/fuculose-1-phosphate aldolase
MTSAIRWSSTGLTDDTRDLSPRAFFRGHGNAVVATNVGLATYRAFYTEMSAQLLLQTRLLDGPITYLDPEEAARINDLRQTGYVRQWELWKRELAGN